MLKMMVVEDEVILRKGICCVGKWDSLGIEISGVAGNGQEALEMVEVCRPDIVLTDVVMPIMDGIELARNLHERYPEIRMIFLSGYEEFDYVKKAMEYKAYNYMLKPAKIEKIEQVVCEVRDEILKERRRVQEEKELLRKFDQSIPILREHYMNQLLNGIEYDEAEIGRKFELCKIELENKNIVVMICEPDREENAASREDRTAYQIALLKLGEICRDVVGSEYSCVVFTDLKDRVVVVLNYPDGMRLGDALVYIQGKAIRIQNEMEEWGQPVSFGIGRFVSSIRYLPRAYKDAEDALDYRFFMGKKSVIYIGDVAREESRDRLEMERQESELSACIHAGDVVGTECQAGKYFALLSRNAVWGQTFIYEEITIFLSNLLRSLRGKLAGEREEILMELEKTMDDLRTQKKFVTLSKLQEQVTDRIRDIAERINSDRLLRNEGVIEKAKNYVTGHLSGDVSLITVADMVYVSPNYLSFLFKESGENFKDYVVRVKMEKAKEMMESGEYNLSQMAQALGYKDGRYFSQVYKKYQEG